MNKKVLTIMAAIIFMVTMLMACATATTTPATTTTIQPESTPMVESESTKTVEFEPTPYEIGNIIAVSNGIEYESYTQTAFSAAKTVGSNFTTLVDYAELSLEKVSKMLPEIKYDDTFEVIVNGKDTKSINYSLCNEKFDDIYRGNEKFVPPVEDGVYILIVEVLWGDESEPQYYTDNLSVFKIRKGK